VKEKIGTGTLIHILVDVIGVAITFFALLIGAGGLVVAFVIVVSALFQVYHLIRYREIKPITELLEVHWKGLYELFKMDSMAMKVGLICTKPFEIAITAVARIFRIIPW
jgi:hypothetical protein